MRDFELASGSVTGALHRAAGRNNQDALATLRWDGGLAAAVCDGCSGGPRSEVGAHLGARLACQAACRLSGRLRDDDPDAMAALAEEVLHHLRPLAAAMAGGGDGLAEVVREALLFTLVGALMLPEVTVIFALGDGLVRINEEEVRLGPFPDNAPPYLGYRLLSETGPGLLPLVVRRLPTAEVRTVALLTDGGADLPPGVLEDLLDGDFAFRNPDAVRRRLFVLNRPGQRGLLPDDTTLVLIRRAAPG